MKLRVLVVKDNETGEEYEVQTVRSAKDVRDCIEEEEKEYVSDVIESALYEAYGDQSPE